MVLAMSLLSNQAFALGQWLSGGSSGNSSGGGGGSTTSTGNESSSSSSSSNSSSSSSSVETSQVVNQILTIINNSSCAANNWRDRGRAPKGYVRGMGLTFARSLCRLDEPQTDRRSPASLMSKAATSDTSRDALAHYKSTFNSLNLPISQSGADTLRSLYTLGIGFGMRESSGKYCQGWDVAAGSNRPSSQAEAGLFQTSYNSISASTELKKLYAEYNADTSRCYPFTFKEGVSCTPRSILGTGEGAVYQRLNKECPAFAAEYAMVMLRVARAHYGPINRKEAEIKTICNSMLEQIQNVVESGGSAACDEIDQY